MCMETLTTLTVHTIWDCCKGFLTTAMVRDMTHPGPTVHGPNDDCGVEVPAGKLLDRAALAAHLGLSDSAIYANLKRKLDRERGATKKDSEKPTDPPAPWFIMPSLRLGNAWLWTHAEAEQMRQSREALQD